MTDIIYSTPLFPDFIFRVFFFPKQRVFAISRLYIARYKWSCYGNTVICVVLLFPPTRNVGVIALLTTNYNISVCAKFKCVSIIPRRRLTNSYRKWGIHFARNWYYSTLQPLFLSRERPTHWTHQRRIFLFFTLLKLSGTSDCLFATRRNYRTK